MQFCDYEISIMKLREEPLVLRVVMNERDVSI